MLSNLRISIHQDHKSKVKLSDNVQKDIYDT